MTESLNTFLSCQGGSGNVLGFPPERPDAKHISVPFNCENTLPSAGDWQLPVSLYWNDGFFFK